MKRAAALLVAVLAGGALVVQSTAASSNHAKVLQFGTMAPVVEPFTDPANPVRGVPGGGLPWELDRAEGELRSDGSLEIRVEGLVLARRAPVPANLQGANPVPQFRAIVSCLTPGSAGQVETVNLTTDPVPATPDGNARFETRVALPEPCIAPIVFVTSPTGAWFAATGS